MRKLRNRLEALAADPDGCLGLVAGLLVSLGPLVGWGPVPLATGGLDEVLGTLVLHEPSFAYHLGVLLAPPLVVSAGAYHWRRSTTGRNDGPSPVRAGIGAVPLAVLWAVYLLMALAVPVLGTLSDPGATLADALVAPLFVTPIFLLFGGLAALGLTAVVLTVTWGGATAGSPFVEGLWRLREGPG